MLRRLFKVMSLLLATGCGSLSDALVDESNPLRASRYEFVAKTPDGSSGGAIYSSQPKIKGSLVFYDAAGAVMASYPLGVKLTGLGITVKYDHQLHDVRVKFSSVNKKRVDQILGEYSSGTKFGGGFIGGTSGADSTNGSGVSAHVGSKSRGSLGVDISMSTIIVSKESGDTAFDWGKTVILD